MVAKLKNAKNKSITKTSAILHIYIYRKKQIQVGYFDSNEVARIDITGVSSGVYIVELTVVGQRQRARLIVE